MNKSIEVLKSIYKPYRYTIKGKSTILETTSGQFVIKEKKKDIKSLYAYLSSRGFTNFPKLVDASRKDVYVYEYISDFPIPKEQKCNDLVTLLASLHNKTSYFKEVSIDKYKEIYENILNNINYLKNYFETYFDKSFLEEYPKPSSLAFMQNFTKIRNNLNFAKNELESWFNIVQDETKIRVALVHNNLCLNHYLKDEEEALISWDNFVTDTPVLDLVKLYQNEWENLDFAETLHTYMYRFPLLDYEKKLFFILISLPPKFEEKETEFKTSREVSKLLDYVYKTEKLIRPYYTEHKEEE